VASREASPLPLSFEATPSFPEVMTRECPTSKFHITFIKDRPRDDMKSWRGLASFSLFGNLRMKGCGAVAWQFAFNH
jgi:hypothetical protein